MVKFLLEKGINVNTEDEGGNTALHFASLNGKKDIVKILLENKANPNATNNKSQKPIEYSNSKGFNEITELLLSFGSTDKAQSSVVNTTAATASQTATTVADKKIALLDLKELLDAGILSVEEFDVEKKKILNQL